jgi:hypothetical protein
MKVKVDDYHNVLERDTSGLVNGYQRIEGARCIIDQGSLFTKKMELVGFVQEDLTCKNTWNHIPEDHNIYTAVRTFKSQLI